MSYVNKILRLKKVGEKLQRYHIYRDTFCRIVVGYPESGNWK